VQRLVNGGGGAEPSPGADEADGEPARLREIEIPGELSLSPFSIQYIMLLL